MRMTLARTSHPILVNRLYKATLYISTLSPGSRSTASRSSCIDHFLQDVTQFEDVMRTMLEVKPDRVLNLAHLLGEERGNPILPCG
jgi:hypothetical protein